MRVDASIESVERYPFRWAGADYDVTTHYFAAMLESPFALTIPRALAPPGRGL